MQLQGRLEMSRELEYPTIPRLCVPYYVSVISHFNIMISGLAVVVRIVFSNQQFSVRLRMIEPG
jgi:hypothetical protein